jgi:uncharacterized protein YkwD
MTHTLHLPTVKGNPNVIQGQSDNATVFVWAWMQALGDRAAMMREDARLTLCASEHAAYLASREDTTPSMHIGRNGSTPDQRVRATGYALPAHWHENHVESCATHTDGPLAALEMLLESPGHRAHLMGEGGFERHVVYGVGSAKSYYVCLICPPEL